MKNRTEFWTAHVAAVKREAISASAYARRNGLSIAALYYWQRKQKSNAGVSVSEQESKFVALRVAEQRPCLCTLLLPSGLHLEMSALPAPEWLAALSRTLTGAR
jgi:transposase-like protein